MRRKVQKEANDDIKAILKGDRFIPVRNRSDPSTKEVNHQSEDWIYALNFANAISAQRAIHANI